MRDKKLVCKEISKFQRSIPCNTSQYRILNVKSWKVEINDKQNSQRLTTKTRWQARVNPFEKKAASKIRSLGTWDCFSSGEISFSFHRALPPISIHFVRLSAAPFVLSGAYTFPLPPLPLSSFLTTRPQVGLPSRPLCLTRYSISTDGAQGKGRSVCPSANNTDNRISETPVSHQLGCKEFLIRIKAEFYVTFYSYFFRF